MNLVQHPLCFACDEEFETFEHLFLKCKNFTTERMQLSLNPWKNAVTDTTRQQLRLLVALIIASWLEEESEYKKWFRHVT